MLTIKSEYFDLEIPAWMIVFLVVAATAISEDNETAITAVTVVGSLTLIGLGLGWVINKWN